MSPYFPKILLASGSPRRSELLKQGGYDFRQLSPEVEEVWPEDLPVPEVPEFLAELKAESMEPHRAEGEIILAADSVVILDGEIMGKPQNREEAVQFLNRLSGEEHEVITGLCLLSDDIKLLGSEVALVSMADLTTEEISFYIDNYKPYDKAGAYGIQEWLGLCRVTDIRGNYSNIMGLPMYLLYEMFENLRRNVE